MNREEREVILKQIGQRIREVREMRHLTQVEVAQKLDVNRVTVTGWETARRAIRVAELYQLARVLRVSVAAFFPEEEMNDS